MCFSSNLSRFVSAWWGATFHPSDWFPQRFEHDAGRGRTAWLAPVIFASVVAAPVLGAGVLIDAWLMNASLVHALGRAAIMVALSPFLATGGVVLTALMAHTALFAMGTSQGGFHKTLSSVGFAAGAEVFAIVPWVGPLIAGVWRIIVLSRALQAAHLLPSYRAVIAVFAGPVWLVGIGMAFRLSVVDTYKVPAGSMIPTILPGDHVLVRRGPYEVERGDVIVFRYPEDPSQHYVKRVIGVEGDEVTVVDGRPSINGWTVPRCRVGAFEPNGASENPAPSGTVFVEFLGPHAYLVFIDQPIAYEHDGGGCRTQHDCPQDQACQDARCVDQQGPFRVRPGEYFVLGDNRYNSHDSRTWFDGRGGGVPESFVSGAAWMIWAHVDPDGTLRLERSGVEIGSTPLLTGPMAESLEPRLRWCLEHRPQMHSAL